MVVNFADLDLTREEGKAKLYHRLENAARKVCGPVHVRIAGSIARVAQNQECFKEAMTSALEKVGIPA